MKKWITVAAMLFMAMAVKAQDCDAIMLAYFNNNQHYKERREKGRTIKTGK